MDNRPKLNLIILHQCSILEQLHLEEALLRVDQRNWCLINQRMPDAIVMGISAQPEQVIDIKRWQQTPVPVIRRFSGGGTVFIDENSLLTTFIFNQAEIGVPCFPQPVFQWSEFFYRGVFQGLEFSLKENDYVIGHQKFGGNAQYMAKHRWLHHTSFLWDYQREKMEYLKMPPKSPQYRQNRSHEEFLCKLNAYFYTQHELFNKLYETLENHFEISKVEISEALEITRLPHRKVSSYLPMHMN